MNAATRLRTRRKASVNGEDRPASCSAVKDDSDEPGEDGRTSNGSSSASVSVGDAGKLSLWEDASDLGR